MLTRQEVEERLSKREKIHRNEIPQFPKNYFAVKDHPLQAQFRQAEQDHLESHQDMGTWEPVRKADIRKGAQILDVMWVYAYKFDTDGYLTKCKARLVV